MYIFIYISLSLYIYIYIHRERELHMNRERQNVADFHLDAEMSKTQESLQDSAGRPSVSRARPKHSATRQRQRCRSI